MIFAYFLTGFFVFMSIYVFVFIRQRLVRLVLLCTYCLAIFFIWHQDRTTAVANYVGVGRGLDLVLVLFSIGIVTGIIFIVQHINAQHQSITKLARHIAISESRKPVMRSDSR